MSGRSPLPPALVDALADGRTIGWEEFIGLALDHPQHGFYASGGRAGRRGDFLTSPEVGPLFGAVVGLMLDEWWTAVGCPAPFTVVDWGAGPGTLARGLVLADLCCLSAMRLVLVERSAAQRALHPVSDGNPVIVSVGDDPPVDGPTVILANELLDNLPFGLRERTHDGWAEVRIGLGVDGGLVESLGPLADAPACAPGEVPVGARVPAQDEARRWLTQARALAGPRGKVIALDYTATTAELARRPWREWVRTFAAHGRGGDPLDDVGHQDVTVVVCRDQLALAARPDDERTQADALRAWGIDELVAEGRAVWRERAAIGDLAALRARSRVGEAEALGDPAGLGAFTVLEWRGTP